MNKKIYRYETNPIVAVDWEKEYGVMALNTDSLVFEYNSDVCDMVVVLYENEDEFDISYELNDRVVYLGYKCKYALYNPNTMEMVGFVVDTEAYDDCLAEEDDE